MKHIKSHEGSHRHGAGDKGHSHGHGKGHAHGHKHNHEFHECRCQSSIETQTITLENQVSECVDFSCCSSEVPSGVGGQQSEQLQEEGEEDSKHSCTHNHGHSHHGHSHHGHDHSHHGHSHNHTVQSLDSVNRAFYIGIGLNLSFTIIEFIVGYLSNSLALLADASHNLSDVASLLISLIGLKLAQKASNSLYTYGYKKASILSSLINAVILVFIAANISIEAVKRMTPAPEVIGASIIVTALIGVFINTLSAFLFYKGQKDDINIKGAFLHLLVDATVSVGVVISGIVIYYTGWNIIDPIISIIIAVVVLLSTWDLLKESIKLTLDGVPKNIDIEDVNKILLNNAKVEGFHDLHIWALSSSQNALTVHLSVKEDLNIREIVEIKNEIKNGLEKININHATIEVDSSGACRFSC